LTAPAATAIYTLSLHDALPISRTSKLTLSVTGTTRLPLRNPIDRFSTRRRGRDMTEKIAKSEERRAGSVKRTARPGRPFFPSGRSEEHTSELQSRENLVCRLLL